MDRKYHSKTLKFAAYYNLIWGAFIIFFPNTLFKLARLPLPTYPQIWQCVGMIVGVYGIGYYIASKNYVRHWPIVLVGFLGKIFGPIGFIPALYSDVFNYKFAITIVFNDLIWWCPFAILLYKAFNINNIPSYKERRIPFEDESIVIFVRHFGCTFCRATLSNLQEFLKTHKLTKKTYLVHMGDETSSKKIKSKYELKNIEIISDPNAYIYKMMNSRRGSFKDLFSFEILKNGFYYGIIKGHGVGKLDGDGFQMGGVYSYKKGKIKEIHIPKDASDLEDWKFVLV